MPYWMLNSYGDTVMDFERWGRVVVPYLEKMFTRMDQYMKDAITAHELEEDLVGVLHAMTDVQSAVSNWSFLEWMSSDIMGKFLQLSFYSHTTPALRGVWTSARRRHMSEIGPNNVS